MCERVNVCVRVHASSCSAFSVQRVALCPAEHFDVSARYQQEKRQKEEVIGSVFDDNTNSVATGRFLE